MNAIHSVEHLVSLPAPDRTAIVLSRQGRNVQVMSQEWPRDARVALSCLMAPEPGDLVLMAEADGTAWVLAVLERHSTAPILLLAERDLTITSSGTMRLVAAADVALDAGAAARVSGHEVEIHASVLRSVTEEILHVGKRITSHITTHRMVAELIESFAEHVLQRARRSTRIVEQTDHLRSSDIDHAATGTVQIQARQAFISADTVVRIDAAQIHMG